MDFSLWEDLGFWSLYLIWITNSDLGHTPNLPTFGTGSLFRGESGLSVILSSEHLIGNVSFTSYFSLFFRLISVNPHRSKFFYPLRNSCISIQHRKFFQLFFDFGFYCRSEEHT